MNINGVFVMNWQSSWSFVNKQGVVDDDGTGWGNMPELYRLYNIQGPVGTNQRRYSLF